MYLNTNPPTYLFDEINLPALRTHMGLQGEIEILHVVPTMLLQGESLQEVEKEFLIWLAGFWEGEGMLSLSTRHQCTEATLAIFQSKERGRKILEAIKEKLGVGSVYVRSSERSFKNTPIYNWSVASIPEVVNIVGAIFPYLKFRQEEVKPKLQKLQQALMRWDPKATRRYKKWAGKDDEILRKMTIENHFAPEISKVLQRTVHAIRHRRQFLGLMIETPWNKRRKR